MPHSPQAPIPRAPSPEAPVSQAPASEVARGALPTLATDLTASEVLGRAEALSRRGTLPGYAPIGRGSAGSAGSTGFTFTAFGEPFDHRVTASVAPGDGARIKFVARPKPLLPAVALVLLALTIWPGVWLTDSLLRTYFPGYDYATWMWYLPITILPLPWAVLKVWRRSQSAAAESARELIERLREATGGRFESAAPDGDGAAEARV